MRLTVCHPGSVRRFTGYRGHWLYMDSSQDEFEALQTRLGIDAIHLMGPHELQEQIATSRAEFTAWIDRNLTGSEAIPLLLTPLTRNPFHALFYRAVMLRVAAKTLAGDDDLLVVTGSSGLMRTLRQYAEGHNLMWVCFGATRFRLTAFRAASRSLLKFFRDIVHAVARATVVRLILGDAQLKRAQDADVLVDTYLLPGDVLADGTVKHRYYPGLVDWYRARGHTPAYYPVPINIPLRSLPGLYRGYRSSSYVFLPLELLCGLSDIVVAAFACAAHAISPPNMRDQYLWGMQIGTLAASGSFSMALDGLFPVLYLRAPQHMARHGIRPRWLLDWFENQPFDQATKIGFRRYQPSCRVIALRLYAQYSSNLLSYQVTNREVDEGVVPAEHWICGEAWLPSARRFDTRSAYRLVPGLRYAYLKNIVPTETDGGDLLVLLTHSVPESTRILAAVGAVLPGLRRWFPSILIKPHPALNVRRVEKWLSGRFPGLMDRSYVHWSGDDMTEVLPRARIAISAGSGSALEAVSQGIPVVIIGADVGIDMCPLEFVDARMWRVVFGGLELECVMAEWSPQHPLSREDRLAIGRITTIRCFEPLSDDGMERFSLD